ncbi:MAG: ABC transporter permease [Saprospiraceae bacterium]|nr:ABC transporter permease [Saprospiraceae bacterium]
MGKAPPNWVFHFLRITCSARHLDELEGDLLEFYERDVASVGHRRAQRKLIWRVLLSPRLYRLPSLPSFGPSLMYRNYFKVAVRSARRYKEASFIQIAGLTLGLAAVLYIALFVKNELAYDAFHAQGDDIYRVLRFDPITGARGHATSSRHGQTLHAEFPFLTVCRLGNDPVKLGEQSTTLVEQFFWTDSTFFDVFTFPVLQGDPSTALTGVNRLVITRSLSEQLFGTVQSVGKSLPVKVYDADREFHMEVSAVVEDPPRHSHIQFRALGSMGNAEMMYEQLVSSWGFSWLRTYVYAPNQSIQQVEAGIPQLITKYLGDQPPDNFGIAFQPLHEVYLQSNDIPKNTFAGSLRNLYIFGSIGLAILLLSILNYVNLSSARTSTRVTEVGIRRVLGSRKKHIVSQFLLESVFFSVLSGVLASLIVILGYRGLNGLFDLQLSLGVVTPRDWGLVFLCFVGIGILAGLLPSLLTAKLPSLHSDHAALHFRVHNWTLSRKLFIGLQYTVTLILLVSTGIIYQQYQFLRNFDLGFDAEQLIHVPIEDRQLQARLGKLKNEIKALPSVISVTATGEDLPSRLQNTWDLSWSGINPAEPRGIDVVGVDRDYFGVVGVDFVQGQNFQYDFDIDSAHSVVLNEQAAALIGTDDLIGKRIQIGQRDRTVVGIVQDHHNLTLHSKLVPIAYFVFPTGFRVSPDNLLIKAAPSQIPILIGQMQKTWEQFSPDPFTYNFVDDAFAAAYQNEQRFSHLIGSFSFIAIVISVIGLFGLILFTIQYKLKEISLRRVFGASQMEVIQLLSKEFVRVFALAILLAVPVALYFMNLWLTDYTYRIRLSGVSPAIAILLCALISGFVIYALVQRTSRVNPSEILSE